MGKNGLKMGVWLSFFYKFAENKEFFQGRFLPYKLGIETLGWMRGKTHLRFKSPQRFAFIIIRAHFVCQSGTTKAPS